MPQILNLRPCGVPEETLNLWVAACMRAICSMLFPLPCMAGCECSLSMLLMCPRKPFTPCPRRRAYTNPRVHSMGALMAWTSIDVSLPKGWHGSFRAVIW